MGVKWIAGACVALTLACNFLLTPLGWEARPFDALSTLGKISIPFFWLTDGLNIAALVKLSRDARAASRLFGLGIITLLVPVLGDQTGLFCPTLAASRAITGLEIVWPVLQFVLFGVTLRNAHGQLRRLQLVQAGGLDENTNLGIAFRRAAQGCCRSGQSRENSS